MENPLLAFFITLAVAGVAGIIFLVMWFSAYNTLQQLVAQVEQAVGTQAAQYKQRFNLIPDACRAAKAAVKAQMDYFDKILEIRRGNPAGLSLDSLGGVPELTFAALSRPDFGGYPNMDVRAHTKLIEVLEKTEEGVTAAERFYWAAVSDYNQSVRSFPMSVVAGYYRFSQIPTAKITPELSTKPVYDI